MKSFKLFAVLLFAATTAFAQYGSNRPPTVAVSHINADVCNAAAALKLPCEQSVNISIGTTDPDVALFRVMLAYVDNQGVEFQMVNLVYRQGETTLASFRLNDISIRLVQVSSLTPTGATVVRSIT